MQIVKRKRMDELNEKELQLASVTEGIEELKRILIVAQLGSPESSPQEMLAKAIAIVTDRLELPEINITLFTDQFLLPDDIISITLGHFEQWEVKLQNPIRSEAIPQRFIIKTRDKYKVNDFLEAIGRLGYVVEKNNNNWLLSPPRLAELRTYFR